MIIGCNACNTRYVVDPDALGPRGRMVRCARCEAVWYQEPPPPPPPPMMGPEAGGLGPPVVAPEPVKIEPPPAAVRPIPPGSNLPVVIRPRRRRSSGAAWAALLLAAVVVAGFGVFGRDMIVRIWPPAARAYEVVGLPVETLGKGLILQSVRSEMRIDKGVTNLFVSGEVENIGSSTRRVPALRVTSYDGDRRALQSWRVRVDRDRVEPGMHAPFTSIQNDISDKVVEVSVTFDDR